MNKAQWIVIVTGIALASLLFLFGKTGPSKTNPASFSKSIQSEISADSILFHAKENLSPDQLARITDLEQSVIRGDVKNQKLEVFHQLGHFWKDSVMIFEPYAWYEAEAARLENSEKSLSFAAHLFLDNLRSEENGSLRKWKALQAKDLFERSLKLDENNDSSIVGLGACYIFGNITDNPMIGVGKARQVADKDSTNIFAQMVLGHGSVLSGQYDKAIDRFDKVLSLQPGNLEAMLMLGEVYERKEDKVNAVKWYTSALPYAPNMQLRVALEKRIEELKR